uniref:Putative secreted protein n=1 Tax=Ixodes ricinus TaxID=34613 RepID=A0A6B0UZT8_IXORI
MHHIFSHRELLTHLLILFLVTTARVYFRLLVGHIPICEDALEHAQPAFGQWHLFVCLVYLPTNGQTLCVYGCGNSQCHSTMTSMPAWYEQPCDPPCHGAKCRCCLHCGSLWIRPIPLHCSLRLCHSSSVVRSFLVMVQAWLPCSRHPRKPRITIVHSLFLYENRDRAS